MARGDHIWVIRPLKYTHHGIDCGDGTVIHFTGEPGKKSDAAVAKTSMADFALDSIVHLREYDRRDDVDKIIERAEGRIGSREYNLVTNNCEHFATWCSTGKTASQQVTVATSLTSSGAAAVTSIGTTAGVVSAVGSVAGLSGSGIMSGLATAGGVVGGGAAAGPLAIGVAPALISVGAVQVALRRDETLPEAENDARRDGRIASAAGAGAAAAGGLGVIGAAGVTGMSAAGISSGLAAIGGVVGGGMVAGTVVVAAAPAVVAGLAGFGIYALSRRLRGVRPKKWTPPPSSPEPASVHDPDPIDPQDTSGAAALPNSTISDES